MDYIISDLPFLPGDYELDVSIYDESATYRYDYWSRCAGFTVLPGGSNERYGLIALEGEWRHTPRARPSSAIEKGMLLSEPMIE